jgi:hypothetical protein
MKKFLFVTVALLAVFAVAAGAVAAETKAPAPKVTTVTGTVTTYIPPIATAGTPGTISVKDAKDKSWTFDIPADVKITGEVKKGGKAKVTYKVDAGKNIATAVMAIAEKKSSQPKPKS